MITNLVIVTLVVFIMNIPFGYWRANVKKFGLQWALSVHIPVPLIVVMRIYSHIGFAWYTYVFLVSAFFFGQRLGAWLHKNRIEHNKYTTSCLVMDVVGKHND